MRFISLLVLFCLNFSILRAQPMSGLDSVNLKRNKVVQHGLLALSGWAAVNIPTGLLLAANSSGETRYFNRMNAYFNLVNLGLSQYGYWRSRSLENKRYGIVKSVAQQQAAERLFLFNTGLDLAYVAGGLYWYERANIHEGEKKNRFRGYGKSIMVQGGVLFLFDGIMYLLQARNGRWYGKQWEKLSLQGGSNGLGLSLKL